MIEYELRGVDESKKQKVLSELQSLIEPASREYPITRIIVTPDFATTVRQFIPRESGEEYNPIHDYGTARAKTIRLIRDGHPHFVIIFDARIFADVGQGAIIGRRATIVHELVHVKNGLLEFESIRKGGFIRQPRTKWEWLLASSWVIWEEYDAERFVWENFVAACKSVDPAAKLEPNLTMVFADDAIKVLKDFDVFVRENIKKFRCWQIDATTITYSITSKIAGILVRLAYVYALRRVSDDVNSKISEIEQNANYLRFFSRNWSVIVDCLDDFYDDRNVYRFDILQKIAEAYDRIVIACGIRLRDAENGFSVSVNDVGE